MRMYVLVSMKRSCLSILFILAVTITLTAQTVTEINKDDLIRLTSLRNDTTYVINFWATWCSPCVKEIGYFEDLHRVKSGSPMKVVLVSLDFPNTIDRRVIPFLKEKKITAPVMLMTDLDYNSWIDRVDPSWSGALPATLIYDSGRRIFLEKELTKEELFSRVEKLVN